MLKNQLFPESKLAGLAKEFRKKAGKSRREAGRELKVSHVSIHRAEENPDESLVKLRKRIIEKYSPFTIAGPMFFLERKKH